MDSKKSASVYCRYSLNRSCVPGCVICLISGCKQHLNSPESCNISTQHHIFIFLFLFPFLVDHSRIRLQLGTNDYINASLITVEEAQRNYILTQVRWRRYCQRNIFVVDMILDMVSKEAGHRATCAVWCGFLLCEITCIDKLSLA